MALYYAWHIGRKHPLCVRYCFDYLKFFSRTFHQCLKSRPTVTGIWSQTHHDYLVCGGFPGSARGKEPACQCRGHGFDPWIGKILWRRWQSTPVFLPGKSHGQRSLEGYSPWSQKSWTRLSTHTHTHTHTHTPWRATVHGVKRVGHDWACTHARTHTHAHTHTHTYPVGSCSGALG